MVEELLGRFKADSIRELTPQLFDLAMDQYPIPWPGEWPAARPPRGAVRGVAT